MFGFKLLVHSTHYWACDYLSMLGLKSIHGQHDQFIDISKWIMVICCGHATVFWNFSRETNFCFPLYWHMYYYRVHRPPLPGFVGIIVWKKGNVFLLLLFRLTYSTLIMCKKDISMDEWYTSNYQRRHNLDTLKWDPVILAFKIQCLSPSCLVSNMGGVLKIFQNLRSAGVWLRLACKR